MWAWDNRGSVIVAGTAAPRWRHETQLLWPLHSVTVRHLAGALHGSEDAAFFCFLWATCHGSLLGMIPSVDSCCLIRPSSR